MIRIGIRAEAEAATSQGDLRGTVEHVGSGRRESFRDARELLAFLQTCTHAIKRGDLDED